MTEINNIESIRDAEFRKRLEITDERLAELQKKMRPVIRKDDVLFYIEEVDPRKIAFTWEPVPTKEATGLVALTTLETIHSYGAPVFFKPSIAEVLAQVPEEFVDQAVAFETNHVYFTEGSGFHTATTTLYRHE